MTKVSLFETRYGQMETIHADTIVSKSVELYGEWAQHELDAFERLVFPGDLVVDAGAFIGTHTLALSRFVGVDGKVVAFEPRREIYRILERNISTHNNLTNVEAFQCGLGKCEDEVPVVPLDLESSENFGGLSLGLSNVAGLTYRTQVRTIDSFSFEKLNFLKLDVEGMELDVVRGAERTIGAHNPVIYAECNNLREAIPLWDWLSSRGYTAYGFVCPAYNKNNFLGGEDNIFGAAAEAGICFFPESGERSAELLLSGGDEFIKLSSVDALAALLLCKPQYLHEVLGATIGSIVQQQENTYGCQALDLPLVVQKCDAFLQERDLLEGNLAAKEAKLEGQRGEIALLNGQLEGMRNSFSWRVTRPLRAGSRGARRGVNAVLNVPGKIIAIAVAISLGLGRNVGLGLGRERFSQFVFWGYRFLNAKKARSKLVLPIAHAVEVEILRSVGEWLFDKEYYLNANPDVLDAQLDPLKHYVQFGAREGRNPCLYFDEMYYRSRSAISSGEIRVSGAVHFLLLGRNLRYSPTRYFDYQLYLERNPDVSVSAVEPFRHFIEHGIYDNRVASNNFDPVGYIESNADIDFATLPALKHYLMHGRELNEQFDQAGDFRSGASRSPLPIDFETAILALPDSKVESPDVSVVVPVYKGKEETLCCLWHVLKADCAARYALVVIDDCSPEPELSESLERIANAGYIELIRNAENKGFVKSVNAGMRIYESLDAVLLNSDTQVFDGWIDRLRAGVYKNDNCATATPLTNNGTICSYPKFVEDNHAVLEVPYDELDVLASEVNAGQTIEIPTAVGFCMYIRRDALEDIGYFDEDAFGIGYGEENDFCLRGQARGWVDVLVADVFVRHLGGMSFQKKKAEQVEKAEKVIGERYPDYNANVRRFVREDPVLSVRANLDLRRLKVHRKAQNVLLISHHRGGGTEQHVLEEVQRLERSGMGVFRMSVSQYDKNLVRHVHARVKETPNLSHMHISNNAAEIYKLWSELGISEIHVHHMADFGGQSRDYLFSLLERCLIPRDVILHDYFSICPRFSLADSEGRYCGEPDEKGCYRCLKLNGSEYGSPSIVNWRKGFGQFLEASRRVIAPNQDVVDRFVRYFPNVNYVLRPHEVIGPRATSWDGLRTKSVYTVATLGAISSLKGLGLLAELSKDAVRRSLPLKYMVIGYTEDDGFAESSGIEVTGVYANENIDTLVAKHGVDLMCFASTAPETYSYTLSVALKLGLPIVANDIGAIAQRLRNSESVDSLILDMTMSPTSVNNKLLSWVGQSVSEEEPE